MMTQLDSRALGFSRDLKLYAAHLAKTKAQVEVAGQLRRISLSIGQAFVAVDMSWNKKAEMTRMQLFRTESDDARKWLGLSKPGAAMLINKEELIQEAQHMRKTFGEMLKGMIV